MALADYRIDGQNVGETRYAPLNPLLPKLAFYTKARATAEALDADYINKDWIIIYLRLSGASLKRVFFL